MNPINSLTKFFAFTALLAIIFIAVTSPIYAQKGRSTVRSRARAGQAKLWQQVKGSSLQSLEQRAKSSGQQSVLPEKYLVFQLNRTSLKIALEGLPLENTDAARSKNTVMEIPMPDGTLQRFRMEETPVLSPELAAQFPTWKTFVGYGIDNPQAIGRFDWNALGFHGYIEGGNGIVMVDPYQKGDTENYLVFYKHEYGKPSDDFSCKVDDQMSSIINSNLEADFSPIKPEFAFGEQLRTYRLAVATTGEFARNAAGFTNNPGLTPQQIRDGAFAVVVTSVNRLIGIFTRELGSSFQLVNPRTDSSNNIIFDDPTTDPYDNTDSSTPPNDQTAVNHSTLVARVGQDAFDIGHLYGTGGGGVAALGAICTSNQKGEGYSARGTNTGDPFVVDYVAHEIGHQFGAPHTYNNVDPSGTCTTRSAANAFEVASGATIMSYVGICANRNLQQFVDTGFPSFHINSLTAINANITNPNGSVVTTQCGTVSGTNAVPTVNAGGAFTIPRLTPFTLTATGGDADTGDVPNLLYSWEQYDLAPSASGTLGTPRGTFDVDNDGVLRPLFRVYSPVSSNSRTYPSLTFILNPANNDATADVNGVRGNQPVLEYPAGTAHPTGFPGAVCAPARPDDDPPTAIPCVIGERLPTVNRTMNFRVSTRDRRGGVQDAGTTVTVAANTGPFQLTSHNSGGMRSAGAQETVTWDVANTGAGTTVNAANVNILLSTDGGQTFPIVLAANTPNDGTETITVPNNPTMTARVRVEAVGNIFFDINNANFQIIGPTAASVSVSGRVVSSLGAGVSNALVILTDQNGVARTVKTNSSGYYRFDDVEAGQTYIFNVSHERYQFSPRVVSAVGDIGEFDFVANN